MSRPITGLDDAAESRAQRRLLLELEVRYRRPIAAEIARASVAMADQYEASRSYPSLPDTHERNMRALYVDMSEGAVRTFGARIIDQGKAFSPDLEQKDISSFAAYFARLALDWVSGEAIRRRIVGVADTTRDQIINRIEAGQESGLGVADIARGIRDRIQSISMQRAALIARTETHGAANYGSDQAARATNLQLEKTWIAAEDLRTRAIFRDDAYDHLSMDGQTVDNDQPFLMPNIYGDPLRIMYPGEAGAPGGAVINCRCTTGRKVKGLM